MKIIVTCGPAYAPIDEVRRITNFSTGELGDILAAALAKIGHQVICFRGHYATHRSDEHGIDVRQFTTNDNLVEQLSSLPAREEAGALFHIAALCDYEVERISDESGVALQDRKVSSRIGRLTLTLVPARKVIRELPALFPKAAIVGWKYEMNGSREDAIQKGLRQIEENGTRACVVNGAAYGPGFAFCTPGTPPRPLRSKPDLTAFLVEWVSSQNEQHGGLKDAGKRV